MSFYQQRAIRRTVRKLGSRGSGGGSTPSPEGGVMLAVGLVFIGLVILKVLGFTFMAFILAGGLVSVAYSAMH